MMLTDLQAVEFELLKQFIAACEELKLTYYLVCGSALGAAKYKGFIPWDDDIDVALPRNDYEIFCSKAPKILPGWCFLQNYHTELQYYRLGSKLRDSRTTYIEIMAENLNINHGVFIDIFPLDVQWSTKAEEKIFKKKLADFEAARRVRLHYNRLSPQNVFMFRANLYRLLFLLFGYKANTSKEIEIFDKYVASFKEKNSDIWCNHANSTSVLEYAPKEQYGEGTWLTFEGIPVRVPEKYDEYLTQKYGNWRADPEKAEQKGHHFYTKCDLNKPFTEYTNNNHKEEKQRNENV